MFTNISDLAKAAELHLTAELAVIWNDNDECYYAVNKSEADKFEKLLSENGIKYERNMI